ncbi:MAG: tRNA pseudouridine(38-40) synthase TruA [Planctomycetes bacterium]|nr:tRNA pseudouridine(38-40) synthase TruA [Planctomycetota bacterium]
MPRRPPLRNLKLTIEYDGTRYFGWQVQDGKPTIQGELQRAVEEITGRRITVIGSGRTDAGVHACGQIANFKTSSRLPSSKWVLALNAHLPEDIRVLHAEDAPADFHAQFHATRKTYAYTVLNREAGTALDRHRVQWVRPPLDAEAMSQAATFLQGTHDFRAFGSEMSKKERTVRTIHVARVERRGDRILFTFTADGFLYNQVRAMVGTLLDVGRGKRPPAWVRQVLESKDRRQAGANVSAKGLCLRSVEYAGVAMSSENSS